MSRRLLADPWHAVCSNGHNSWGINADSSCTCSQCGLFEELHDAADLNRDPNPMHR